MPRVFRIEKCRKAQKCGKCSCEVEVGQPYIYWTKRVGFGRISGIKYVRCAKPECYPKASELTSSEFFSNWEAIKEGIDFDSADSVEDLESQRDSAVSEIENLRDETQGKFDNMPEGLQQGDTGQLLEERVNALTEVADNLGGVDISFDEPDKEEDQTDEQYETAKDEALQERLDEIRTELNDALDLSCG